MAVERYGSKTDVVVKLVLVFFIALLSFSIGTFVGKKFSDNQHKLAQLESNPVQDQVENKEDRGVASVPPDANDVKPNSALSDEEIAKLAEEFVSDDAIPVPGKKDIEKNEDGKTAAIDHKTEGHAVEAKAETKEAAPAAKEVAPVAKKMEVAEKAAIVATKEVPKRLEKVVKVATHAEPMKVAQALAENKDFAKAEAETSPEKISAPKKRIPSSLPKDIASSAFGKYTVQVASYPTEKEAQTLASELKEKGFSAFYVPAKIKGDTWYRVGVGLFTTQKEAQSYKSDLVSKAKVSSAIVQKVSPQ